MLDEAGSAYLSDFGIAKQISPAPQTSSGQVVGSPAYISPEVVNGDPLTPQTDLYSLGIVLYEMLTGRHPFPHTSPPQMLFKQLTENLPALPVTSPDLSAALNEVIQRATAKTPGDRYPDARALALAFRAALTANPALTLSTEALPLLTPNPYKGLHAFQEGDAADFFGREAVVAQLLTRLKETEARGGDKLAAGRFLAVVGPSGSGKSSLVKAGLIPTLRHGALPTAEQWFIVEMTPGRHPWEELEAALLRIAINPPASLLEQLRAGERGLLRAVKRILPDAEAELLLVIDQLEELFTLVEEEAVRRHFLDSLRVAVTDPASQLRLVLTLRADFYDRPLLYPAFGDLLRSRMETLLPLSPAELEQAISGPARRVGASLEPGLVPRIIAEVQEQPGTLPLLQYALTELYERRQGHRLTLEGYQASGGVLGTLGHRTETLYTELDGAGRLTTRRLFQFGRHRLLTFDWDPASRDPTVEVGHEALFRDWERLRQWLDEDREFLLWQQRLRAGLHQWQASGHFAVSPNGSVIVAGHRDGTLRTWNIDTGQELPAPAGHPEWINNTIFSPDGTRLATASDDFTAKVWDVATNQELLTLAGHTDLVWDVTFSPDGTRLATASDDRTVKIWDAETGQELLTLTDFAESVGRVSFSPDGTRLVAASGDSLTGHRQRRCDG